MTARQQKETETRVDASEFIKRLEDLFERTKDARSVHICAKQVTHINSETSSSSPLPLSSSTHPMIFRVSDGGSKDRIRFSTIVYPSELPSFQETYLTALRSNLVQSLKKRDKAKERRVDKVLAASRKKLEEHGGQVKIGGAKRGAGRRKRMRALRRARNLRQMSSDGQTPQMRSAQPTNGV